MKVSNLPSQIYMWMNRSGVLSLVPQNLNWIIWGSFWTSQLRHMVEPYLVPQNVHSLTIVLLICVYFQGYLIICCIDCFGMTDFWRMNVCQHEIYWALGLLKMKETPRVAAALIPHYARFSRSCKIRIKCCDPFLKSIVGSPLYVPPVGISRFSTHLGRTSCQKNPKKRDIDWKPGTFCGNLLHMEIEKGRMNSIESSRFFHRLFRKMHAAFCKEFSSALTSWQNNACSWGIFYTDTRFFTTRY